MIFLPKSPHATKSQPAQWAYLNGKPSTDAPITAGAFATPSKSAKPKPGLASGKHRMRSPAILTPALQSRSAAVSGSCRQKQIPSRRRISIGLAMAYFLTVPTHGSVTILSQEYHCSGETPPFLTSYSFTEPSPVNGSDLFSASSSAWMFGAYAGTTDSSGRAGAYSMFVFTVDKPILIIKLAGNLQSTAFADLNGGISYSLAENFDNGMNIGSQRWSLTEDDGNGYSWGRTIDESITFNLVIGTQYKLLLTADVTSANGSYASLNAVLVPEPSSILLISLGGLRGLFLRRRIPT